MVKPAPIRFNPDLMARDATRYRVEVPLAQFTRLRDLLHHDTGSVAATFGFSRRKDHIVVSGRLETTYTLQCQRCLEPMQFPVDESFELVFVDSDAAAQRLPSEFDPVVLDDTGQIHIVDMLEDELLLHLPTIARHDDSVGCELAGGVEAQTGEPETARRDNPFEALKDLDLH